MINDNIVVGLAGKSHSSSEHLFIGRDCSKPIVSGSYYIRNVPEYVRYKGFKLDIKDKHLLSWEKIEAEKASLKYS